MNSQVNTLLLILGVLMLGLALIFSPDASFLSSLTIAPSSTPSLPIDSYSSNEQIQDINEELNSTYKEEEPPHKEILGKLAKDLRVVSEELLIIQKEQKNRLSQQELYTIASKRVVNLFCERNGNEVSIATGVIIHKNGYILTNAHVADNEKPRSCLIRHGSPARNFAIAERVFQPPEFSSDLSTRENLARDVAIWKITDVLLERELSASFPSLAIYPNYKIVDGSPLATFSYPAELLGSHNIVSALYLSFSETTVQSHDMYFIESSQGLGSQKGSSGGVLLDPYTGEFAGLIFAINNANTTSISDRTLFSLTPFAINETIRTATGKDLATYLAENP